MPAAYTNLYIEQGSTFSTSITLDDVYLNSYNLVGFTANSEIRKSYYSANTLASFSTIINSSTGTIILGLSAANTANLPPGRWVYDTKITDQNNNVTRILEGIAEVSPSVSR
jgi:hypothetical protein